MKKTQRSRAGAVNGFSLVELLVVIAVISIIAGVAIANVSNSRSAAQLSAIALQEKNLNNIYQSLKAATKGMPTTQDEILNYLATNASTNFVPPDTMESPEGTLALNFRATEDLFAYDAPQDGTPTGGESETPGGGGTGTGSSSWNPPSNGITSSHTGQYNYNGTSAQEAWFNNNPTTAAGGEDYYLPQEGGYQFEPFKISVNSDGTGGTLTTQSGQTYDLANNQYIQLADSQIHWSVRPEGGIKVSSVVARGPND